MLTALAAAFRVLAASLPLPHGSLCSRLSSGAWQGEFNISTFGSGQLAGLQLPLQACQGELPPAAAWQDPSLPLGQWEGRAAHDRSQVAADASPGTGAAVSLPADCLPSGEVRRRRVLPEMLRCRRGTNCSAAVAVVSLCRHLKPLGGLSPRLVLGACLLPSQCTRGSEKPLGQPAVHGRCLAAARISLRWVDEHGVPRAAVLSPPQQPSCP